MKLADHFHIEHLIFLSHTKSSRSHVDLHFCPRHFTGTSGGLHEERLCCKHNALSVSCSIIYFVTCLQLQWRYFIPFSFNKIGTKIYLWKMSEIIPSLFWEQWSSNINLYQSLPSFLFLPGANCRVIYTSSFLD